MGEEVGPDACDGVGEVLEGFEEGGGRMGEGLNGDVQARGEGEGEVEGGLGGIAGAWVFGRRRGSRESRCCGPNLLGEGIRAHC